LIAYRQSTGPSHEPSAVARRVDEEAHSPWRAFLLQISIGRPMIVAEGREPLRDPRKLFERIEMADPQKVVKVPRLEVERDSARRRGGLLRQPREGVCSQRALGAALTMRYGTSAAQSGTIVHFAMGGEVGLITPPGRWVLVKPVYTMRVGRPAGGRMNSHPEL